MSTGSALSGFCRVALYSPTVQVDLALPHAVSLISLMPGLLRCLGYDVSGGHEGWLLCSSDGRALEPARSLRANGVLDGDVVVLQPVHAVIDAPLFDDLLEGSEVVTDRWSMADRRAAAMVAAACAGLVAVTALMAGARSQPLVVESVAASLLLGGAILARSVGELMFGGLAFSGGAVLASLGAAVSAPGGCLRLLAAGAVLAVSAVGLPLVVGGWTAVAGALGTVASAQLAAAGLLGLVHDATRAAAIIAVLCFAVTPTLPAVSLRLAQVPRPRLHPPQDEGPLPVREQPGPHGAAFDTCRIDDELAHLRDRVASSRRVLTAMTAGALGAGTIACAELAADGSPAPRVLALALVSASFLRARIFTARLVVLVHVVAGIVGLAVVGSALVASGHTWWAAGSAGVVTTAALAHGAGAGRVEVSPGLQRIVDGLETVLLLSLAPLLLGACGAFSLVWGLAR